MPDRLAVRDPAEPSQAAALAELHRFAADVSGPGQRRLVRRVPRDGQGVR